jgi:hypothetical protein
MASLAWGGNRRGLLGVARGLVDEQREENALLREQLAVRVGAEGSYTFIISSSNGTETPPFEVAREVRQRASRGLSDDLTGWEGKLQQNARPR